MPRCAFSTKHSAGARYRTGTLPAYLVAFIHPWPGKQKRNGSRAIQFQFDEARFRVHVPFQLRRRPGFYSCSCSCSCRKGNNPKPQNSIQQSTFVQIEIPTHPYLVLPHRRPLRPTPDPIPPQDDSTPRNHFHLSESPCHDFISRVTQKNTRPPFLRSLLHLPRGACVLHSAIVSPKSAQPAVLHPRQARASYPRAPSLLRVLRALLRPILHNL